MGANLVPIVRMLSIEHEAAAAGRPPHRGRLHTARWHRLLRYDFLSHNIGDAHFVVGNPDDEEFWRYGAEYRELVMHLESQH